MILADPYAVKDLLNTSLFRHLPFPKDNHLNYLSIFLL